MGEIAFFLLFLMLLWIVWRQCSPRGCDKDATRDDAVSQRSAPSRTSERIAARGPVRAPIPPPGEIRGRAHVIDGDTIVIGRIKLRLWGIDAPELDEPWGQKSKWEMVRICKGQTIVAVPTGETSHDRLVAKCYLESGEDIAGALVLRGLALDWPLFSDGAYRRLETPEFRRKLSAVRRKMRASAGAGT